VSFFTSCKNDTQFNKPLEIKAKENLFRQYDKVRLLSYNHHRYANESDYEIVISNEDVKIKDIEFVDDVILSEQYKRKISNAITKEAKDCLMADCYNPRHLLVFYQKDKLVGYYEFCAECGGSRQSEGIKVPSICTEQGDALIEIFKELKLKNNGEETEDYQYF
jgi:hypothetical protein